MVTRWGLAGGVERMSDPGTPAHAAPSPSRQVALTCLLRVEKGDQASQALARQLGKGGLSPADRRLATELTYGTVRMRLEIDYVLSRFLKRDLRHMPAGVRAALRLGAYQLLHLSRVPRRAAVFESVELVRSMGQTSMVAMTNAVLRRVDPENLPPWPSDPVEALSLRFSHPRWLVEAWLGQYGPERTDALLRYDNEAPPLTVRVSLNQTRDEALDALQAVLQTGRPQSGVDGESAGAPSEATVVRTRFAPRGLSLRSAGDVTALPLFQEGWLTVQDEASMLAVDLLGARPGETVVDACAGLGTKTWGLLETVSGGDEGSSGRVLALDQGAGKIRELLREAARRQVRVAPVGEGPALDLDADRPFGPRDSDLAPVHGEDLESPLAGEPSAPGDGERTTLGVDAWVGTAPATSRAALHGVLSAMPADARNLPAVCEAAGVRPDRILLDAPCTGLGVLRRRPELRFRRTAEDAGKLHGLQVALLEAALRAVRSGGEVLYVTCSTDRLENEQVVTDALAVLAGASAERISLADRVPEGLAPGIGEDGSLRLFGPETGTDSFFFARVRRTA